MRFEARELVPWAEPLTSSELQEGVTYFTVTFVDEKGLVPEMRPVVFVGIDLTNDGQGQLYFQDYDSYHQGVRYSAPLAGEGGTFDVFLPADMGFVFDYEHALDVLLRCSLQRRGFRLTDE
jgi:hypothetical protein